MNPPLHTSLPIYPKLPLPVDWVEVRRLLKGKTIDDIMTWQETEIHGPAIDLHLTDGTMARFQFCEVSRESDVVEHKPVSFPDESKLCLVSLRPYNSDDYPIVVGEVIPRIEVKEQHEATGQQAPS